MPNHSSLLVSLNKPDLAKISQSIFQVSGKGCSSLTRAFRARNESLKFNVTKIFTDEHSFSTTCTFDPNVPLAKLSTTRQFSRVYNPRGTTANASIPRGVPNEHHSI